MLIWRKIEENNLISNTGSHLFTHTHVHIHVHNHTHIHMHKYYVLWNARLIDFTDSENGAFENSHS